MNPSTALARVLVDALVQHGVRELVLSPGSRSAPLALAALDRSRSGSTEPGGPDLRLHVRIDERSAGFLALGLAKRSGRPVAVVTTSGTAVANLHPAVLEAHHAGVGLVVLTADRPHELRGVGANQTTDQVAIFGAAVRYFAEVGPARREVGQVGYWRDVVARAVAAAVGTLSADPGPVHLDVALADPLVPSAGEDDDWPEPVIAGAAVDMRPVEIRPAVFGGLDIGAADVWDGGHPYGLRAGPRTVVLAGDGAGPEAAPLAEGAGWPLLAEPSSGARGGPNAIGPYRLLLETPGLGAAIERVVVLGHATLSRPVTRLVARADVEVVVVTTTPRWADPARRARTVVRDAGPSSDADGRSTNRRHGGRAAPDSWLAGWLEAAALAEAALDQVLDGQISGPAVARAIGAGLAPDGLLVSGSSSAVRDLDLAMRPQPSTRPVGQRVLANRGLAGIDGTVSTAIGAALAHGGPAVALLGDLAFLHDANGLVIGPEEPRPDLTLVVLDDDGGGLFHLLEQGGPAHAAQFERVFGTPHGADLAALCAATGTAFATARTVDELTALLSERTTGIRVVRVPITRTDRREQDARIAAAVAAAVSARPTA